MAMLKGITVILMTETVIGHDEFNAPITNKTEVSVDNVLVYPSATSDVLDILNLTGKTAIYQLCIPKGDENDWTNKVVKIRGESYMTIGIPQEFIEDMVPLDWNKKIQVERYE